MEEDVSRLIEEILGRHVKREAWNTCEGCLSVWPCDVVRLLDVVDELVRVRVASHIADKASRIRHPVELVVSNKPIDRRRGRKSAYTEPIPCGREGCPNTFIPGKVSDKFCGRACASIHWGRDYWRRRTAAGFSRSRAG